MPARSRLHLRLHLEAVSRLGPKCVQGPLLARHSAAAGAASVPRVHGRPVMPTSTHLEMDMREERSATGKVGPSAYLVVLARPNGLPKVVGLQDRAMHVRNVMTYAPLQTCADSPSCAEGHSSQARLALCCRPASRLSC